MLEQLFYNPKAHLSTKKLLLVNRLINNPPTSTFSTKNWERKILKMHFQNVFYCSTLSAPISRCIKMFGIQQRENIFFIVPKQDKNSKTFPIFSTEYMLKIFLSAECTQWKHTENCYKNKKFPLLGKKLFFLFHLFL